MESRAKLRLTNYEKKEDIFIKTIIYAGKEVTLLTQKEKAQELGISARTLWDHLRTGKHREDIVELPGSTKRWFLQKNEQNNN